MPEFQLEPYPHVKAYVDRWALQGYGIDSCLLGTLSALAARTVWALDSGVQVPQGCRTYGPDPVPLQKAAANWLRLVTRFANLAGCMQ